MIRFACPLLAASLLLLPTGSRGEWREDGTPVAIPLASAYELTSVSDGAGGAIVTWRDARRGHRDIFAQRVDRSGVTRWMPDGATLCAAPNAQSAPVIATDGAGGAIVAWWDDRSGNRDIYAQRIDAAGTVRWAPDGVAICTTVEDQSAPELVATGDGGVIVTWRDNRNGNFDIFAQRVDASGAVQWTADGAAICEEASGQAPPEIVSDGAGGAIVVWRDDRTGTGSDVFAQRTDASGAVLWTPDGVALCSATGSQIYPVVVSDGAGGAIAAWQDARGGPYEDIYAQRVDASGIVQWTVDGVAVVTAANYQRDAAIVSDGAGGAIVAWVDLRGGGSPNIYAQRADASGAFPWTANGVPVCTADNSQGSHAIVPDGTGGAIIAWDDGRSGGRDIYAQRVDGSGAFRWTSNGVPVCAASNGQNSPTIVLDDAGGAIVAWLDDRTDAFSHVFAQRVEGMYGYPGSREPLVTSVADIPGDQGRQVRIEFARSNYDDAGSAAPIWQYEAYRRIDPAAASTPGVLAEGWEQVGVVNAHGESDYAMVVPTLADSTIVSGQHYSAFFIRAATTEPATFFDSPVDSGYSVDNLAPGAPLNLFYEAGRLSWDESAAADFDYFTVYGAGTDNFAAATRVSYTVAPALDVEGSPYAFYYVTATDFSGNEGEPATVNAPVGGTPERYVLSLSNHPNPFNPRTVVSYTVPARGNVTVAIYDTRGARVATLLKQEDHDAGAYRLEWDGWTDDGERVSSGVYFARIEHAGATRTRKMVLLR